MTQPSGTRSKQRSPQRGAVLFGLAGGMLVVAAGMLGGYYVLGTKSEARASTTAEPGSKEPAIAATKAAPAATGALASFLGTQVALKIAGQSVNVLWTDLGLEVDPDQSPVSSD